MSGLTKGIAALCSEDVVGDVSIAFRGTGIEPITSSHYTSEAAAATLAIERQVGPIASAGRSGCAARNGSPWLPRWDPVGPEGLCRDLVGTLQWREDVWKWCLWKETSTLWPFALLMCFCLQLPLRHVLFPSCMRLPPPPPSLTPQTPFPPCRRRAFDSVTQFDSPKRAGWPGLRRAILRNHEHHGR